MDGPEFVSGGVAGGFVGIVSHFYNKFMLDRRLEKMGNDFAITQNKLTDFELYVARHHVTNEDLKSSQEEFRQSFKLIVEKIDRLDLKLDGKADK